MPGTIHQPTAGIIFAAIIALSPGAEAAIFKQSMDPTKTCSAIQIKGKIRPGDFKRFAAALQDANKTAPLRRLYLDSPGGDLLTALAIAELTRKSVPGVETIVPPRKSCSSACIIVLAAGSGQKVSADATIILHQAAETKTGQPNAVVTKGMGQYLVSLGLEPQAAATMANLRKGQELALTHTNAKRLGFGSFDFFGSTNPPATPQCTWKGFIAKRI